MREIRLSFSPALTELLAAPRIVGRTGKVFNAPASNSSVNNLHSLAALLRERDCQATLEIGIAFGASALLFADHHKARGSEPKSHVAIDPYQATVWDGAGLEVVDKAGLGPWVDARHSPSAITLPELLEAGRTFCLIYVDGSHIFEDVFIDAYYGVRLLREMGVIALDDCADPHVRKVIAFLRTVPGMREIDLSAYREPSVKYRVARWLGRTQLRAFERIGSVTRPWDAPFKSF